MKLPKFMIAQNPLVDIDSLYIVHTRKPMFIASVHQTLNDDEQSREKLIEKYATGSATVFGKYTYVLGVENISNDEQFLALPLQKQADKLAGITRRMADWFRAYLKNVNEIKRIEEEGM
jgi:hypothetical protein